MYNKKKTIIKALPLPHVISYQSYYFCARCQADVLNCYILVQ